MIRILQPCKLLQVQRKFGDELCGDEERTFFNEISEQVRESLINSKIVKIIDETSNGEDTNRLQSLQKQIDKLEARIDYLEGEERSRETFFIPDLLKKGDPVFFKQNNKTLEGIAVSKNYKTDIVKTNIAGKVLEVKFSDLVKGHDNP